MKLRQVHLDFHTSEAIDGIGKQFDKKQFQEALKAGHVNSITLFSKCHHGWAYHPSKANTMHPHLDFDLLGEQIAAAHEIGVKTPVYLSAGLDEKLAADHHEWLRRNADETTTWATNFLMPGYHEFCMNSPYLDILLAQIAEVVETYDCDGIFLDIVGPRMCYCQNCLATLRAEGKDPADTEAVRELGMRVYLNYTDRVEQTIHAIKPDMPIFHNSGHLTKGVRRIAYANTHLELESLPTGGWGYDHFPLSARYAAGLGMEFLGMTGKFHESWGEFGGFKHPNALRYETALSLANGAGCSIGDQLHPSGKMDPATYALIGAAYSEVEQKEPWCKDATYLADIGILSQEAVSTEQGDGQIGTRYYSGDVGAVRAFSEAKLLFDVLDTESDFTKYKVLVLPDTIRLDETLECKIRAYLQAGGKLFATGTSGLKQDQDSFALDFGVDYQGPCAYQPTYLHPDFQTDYLKDTDYVVYAAAQDVAVTSGSVIAKRVNPYFNRTAEHFCSHRHAPADIRTAFPGVVCKGNTIYAAWNLFEDYATHASLVGREVIAYCIKQLLGDAITLRTNLPAQGIATVMHQPGRYINHLLYASPIKRGEDIEVIEDILPVYNVQVSVKLPEQVNRVYLAPQMTEIPFTCENGRINYTVEKLECHQMVVLDV